MTITEMCDQFGLPFDLMIGVNRGVYAGACIKGVTCTIAGFRLYIQYRCSLTPSRVNFPVSVLASVTNWFLVSYSWIFLNVRIVYGHWWYSNTPAYIEHDLARLEAIPQTKTITITRTCTS
ncbi:MAG: hypothetical protein U0894_04420 [Pirellulales bacterium]